MASRVTMVAELNLLLYSVESNAARREDNFLGLLFSMDDLAV